MNSGKPSLVVRMALASITIAGCQHATGPSNPTLPARNYWLEEIGLGTSAEDAQRIMELNGYSCSMRRDDSFEAGRVVRPHIDYIYCVRRIANFGSPGEFENQIAIVLEQDAVTDVLSNNVWGPPWESNNVRESPATLQRPELSENTS